MAFACTARAQIVDDTTQLIYGPHTTFYVLENEVLNNQEELHQVDTTLDGLHNFRAAYRAYDTPFQDLGQWGTALNHMFYQRPRHLGRQMGFDAFLPYAADPEFMKFYDTRSPFADVSYVQGGHGQQMGRASYTRNISPQWNFGFDLDRFTAHRNINLRGRNDIMVSHWQFNVHSRYFSADRKYQIMGSFTTMDHSSGETGGIDVGRLPADDLFFFELSPSRLRNPTNQGAISVHKQTALRVYQQYAIDSVRLQVFHVFDGRSRLNRFRHQLQGTPDTLFYTQPPFSPDNGFHYFFNPTRTYDQTRFFDAQNTFGVKGNAGNLYYRGWYRNRVLDYHQIGLEEFMQGPRTFVENFFGGLVRYDIGDNTNVDGSAEINPGRDYYIRSNFRSKYFIAGANHMAYSPTMLQQHYVSNQFIWNNDFDLTTLTDGYAGLRYRNSFLRASVTGNVSRLDNYIYFNQQAVPEQATEQVNVYSADLNLHMWWRFLNFELFARRSHTTGADVIRLPQNYLHSRFYLEGPLFRDALFLQLGADVLYFNRYRGDNYMPVTQQFYLNDGIGPGMTTGGYPLLNVFLNAQIKTVRVFAQLNHANQYIFDELFDREGYFMTPLYTDLPMNFIFGVNWRFYD
ncbi:putative porin [Cytophagaceae bacterium ABcell3]|nr:putative porin [Cytophagaceae bacterium ABcell3]